MSKPNLPVAIIQKPPVFLNLKASIAQAIDDIRQVAKQGVRLAVFPETWLPGYPLWLDHAPGACLWDSKPAKALHRVLFDNALDLQSEDFTTLHQAVIDHGLTIVMGCHERRGNSLYNTMLFLGPAADAIHIHRKMVPTFTERLVWGRGDGSSLKTLDSDWGKLGGLVCWEHWMPLARAALHARTETVHVAQWPMVKDLHMIASRHYAFEGRCFVLASGTYLRMSDVLDGFDSLALGSHPAREVLESMPYDSDHLIYNGGSAVIAPDTSFVAGPLLDDPGTVFAELDLNLIAEELMTLDTDGHYSRPDIFDLRVRSNPDRNVTFSTE